MGENELTRIRFAMDDLRHVVCNRLCSQGGIFMNESKEKPQQTKKLVMIGIRRRGERGFTIKVAE